MLTNRVGLLHDTLKLHMTNAMKKLLAFFKYIILSQLVYFLEEALSDYHLFTFVKFHKSGNGFSTNEAIREVGEEVEKWTPDWWETTTVKTYKNWWNSDYIDKKLM